MPAYLFFVCLFQISVSVKFQTVAVITTVPILRVATVAPALQTLFWALMVEAVHAQRVMVQATMSHVKVSSIFITN